MLNNYTDDILTVEQLCEVLYIGRNSAYKLLISGEIGAFRIGRTWKIPSASLENYIMKSSRFANDRT
jgi:excisionase family DNA binding protein